MMSVPDLCQDDIMHLTCYRVFLPTAALDVLMLSLHVEDMVQFAKIYSATPLIEALLL